MKTTILFFFLSLGFIACKKEKPIHQIEQPIVEYPLTLTNTLNMGSSCTSFSRELFGAYVSEIHSLKQTDTGGYLTVGTYTINSIKKNFILKMDCFGETVSLTEINSNLSISVVDFLETTNGDMVLLCSIESPIGGGNFQNYLMKVDEFGAPIWGNILNMGNESTPKKLAVNSNGNFIITGSDLTNGGYIIETNSDGNIVWSDYFGTKSLFDFVIKPNNHLLICGSKNQDIFVSEIGLGGTIVWTKSIDKLNQDNIAKTIILINNSIFLTGQNNSIPGPGGSEFLISLDNLGNEMWYSTLIDERQMTSTGDNQLILSKSSYHALNLQKINTTDGSIIWETNQAVSSTALRSAYLTADNGFVFLGHSYLGTNSKFAVIKTNSSGY